MATNAGTVGTPYYVLLDANRRIGPEVAPLASGAGCSTIYGFSDKGVFDTFCTNSQRALRPYPLVKDYLRSQAGEPHDGLRLVVIDAAGPRDPFVQAATMETVLEAQEERTPRVTAAYRLAFDPQTNAYRVEEGCV